MQAFYVPYKRTKYSFFPENFMSTFENVSGGHFKSVTFAVEFYYYGSVE